MSKVETNYMSIGEIAKSLGLTRRIILNYEDKKLIKPDRKDGVTGNRYYSADTLTRIRTIRILQNLGISLDEIYSYFDGTTDMAPLVKKLETLRDELNLNIEKLKERIKSDNDYEIKEVMIPEQTVYKCTRHAVTTKEKIEHLREIIPAVMRKYGSDTSKRMYFIEYDTDFPEDISYCIAVPSNSEGEFITDLPEAKALCIFFHGSYESIPEIRDKIILYAKENGFICKNICRHIYLEGPPQHKDSKKFITQIAVIIE